MQQWQFINNFNQLNMFRAIVSPILRSTRPCLQLVVYSTDDAAGWWHWWGGSHLCQSLQNVLFTTGIPCTHYSSPSHGPNFPSHFIFSDLIRLITFGEGHNTRSLSWCCFLSLLLRPSQHRNLGPHQPMFLRQCEIQKHMCKCGGRAA